MSKFSKNLILMFLILSLSIGFTISHFSQAENSENNAFTNETSDSKTLASLISSTENSVYSVYICPGATSLEEVNPLCNNGVVVLNIGESKEGMLLTTTIYEDEEYYLVIGFKNGGGGEFGIVEKSIKNLNDYIQYLPDNAFKNNPQQRKNALKNKLIEVFIKIENKEYQDAINKLQNDIRAKADGDATAEDWIINSTAQQEISAMTDDLIYYLRNL